MSKYNPQRPITAQNCPTREALEAAGSDPLSESIHARHSLRKKLQHQANVMARAIAQANGRRSVPRPAPAARP